MPSVFLSYRRADSMEYTSRIYDRLVQSFGTESIFRDIDSIPLGIAFPELLKQTLSRTGVVLVIIGPTWLSVTNTQGQRRLIECGDLVCMEVETALHLDLAVIPVVVANAQMPRESDLPDSIRELALRNGFAVRPDPDFHRDMERLCFKVQELLGIADLAARKAAMIEQMLAKYRSELEQQEKEQERLREERVRLQEEGKQRIEAQYLEQQRSDQNISLLVMCILVILLCFFAALIILKCLI